MRGDLDGQRVVGDAVLDQEADECLVCVGLGTSVDVDGQEKLRTLRLLSEQLETGEPLEKLLKLGATVSQLQTRVTSVERKHAAGKFATLHCQKLVVGAGGKEAAVLSAEDKGGTLQVFNRAGKRIGALGPTSNEDGALALWDRKGVMRVFTSASTDGGEFRILNGKDLKLLELRGGVSGGRMFLWPSFPSGQPAPSPAVRIGVNNEYLGVVETLDPTRSLVLVRLSSNRTLASGIVEVSALTTAGTVVTKSITATK